MEIAKVKPTLCYGGLIGHWNLAVTIYLSMIWKDGLDIRVLLCCHVWPWMGNIQYLYHLVSVAQLKTKVCRRYCTTLVSCTEQKAMLNVHACFKISESQSINHCCFDTFLILSGALLTIAVSGSLKDIAHPAQPTLWYLYQLKWLQNTDNITLDCKTLV